MSEVGSFIGRQFTGDEKIELFGHTQRSEQTVRHLQWVDLSSRLESMNIARPEGRETVSTWIWK